MQKVAERNGIARNIIRTYLRPIETDEVGVAVLLALEDAQLSQIVFMPPAGEDNRHEDLLSGLAQYDKQFQRVGITRKLLWEECRDENPQGYGYSWFCEHLHHLK